MILSRKAKEAIKTALAMTTTYGIALAMDWDKPMWAGFAVAMISLATIGQSLNKGAKRMLGTLVAAGVALTLIALFPQDRWLFMLFLSVYVGICTYMMGLTTPNYFWHVCGFVGVIICMNAGPNPINAFDTVVLRLKETGLGILVYSLVSILIWPSSTRAAFHAATCKLVSTQQQVYHSYWELMSGQGNVNEAQALRVQEIQERIRFDQLLDAAEADSYEVWELRQQWRCFQGQLTDLMETMEGWRASLKEVKELDLSCLLPNLDTLTTELKLRFSQIARMLAGDAPEREPQVIDLSYDKGSGRSLSHFHKAAFAVTRTQLQNLENLTRAMFDRVSDIKGFGQADDVAETALPRHARFVLDPDRITSAVREMVTLWLIFLAVIYVEGFPGGTGSVGMAAAIGMAMAARPQIPVSKLYAPAAFILLFTSLVYIFVMPQLSSFIGLGLVIFLWTFAICYLFAAPQQGLGRALGLAMFVSVASISNEQTYNFLLVANTAMMWLLILLLLTMTAHIPFSRRPELTFLRLLSRFFRSSEYLMSTMRWDPTRSPSCLNCWRKAFHAREVSTLPTKLRAWAPHINTKVLPGTSPEQVQALIISLQALTYRTQELLKARGNAQAPILVQELLADVRAWRLSVQETFHRLSVDPAAGEREAFRTQLPQIMVHLEARIEKALDKAAEGQLSDKDGEKFYRLVGAYRAVSEALVDYVGSAGVIDWARWREERFS